MHLLVQECGGKDETSNIDLLTELVNYLIRRNIRHGTQTEVGCLGSMALILHACIAAPRPFERPKNSDVNTECIDISTEPPRPPTSLFDKIKQPLPEEIVYFDSDEELGEDECSDLNGADWSKAVPHLSKRDLSCRRAFSFE